MLLALPLLIPLLTACLCLIMAHNLRVVRGMSVVGAVGLLAAAIALLIVVWQDGTQRLYVGAWEAPYGITLVGDLLAAMMVFISAIMHLTCTVYALATINNHQQRRGYFAFVNVLLMGICGAFLTGDLFNLYVWFEVMLIASFILMVLGNTRQEMEAGIKYVTLSLLSSALFLAAVGVIYSTARTLNMADLTTKLHIAADQAPSLVTAASVLLLISFGIKAAIFPLYYWLPASYHTPAPVVSALFAGLLTKVGVYAILRVVAVVFPPSEYTFSLLLWAAGLTMVLGVFGAISQMQMRQLLSFHIISQIGYMILGIGLLATPSREVRELAVAATIFYVVHNIFAKSNLFLISGVIRAMSGTEQLPKLGGYLNRAPWLALLFLIPALGLAGVPPLSGFWAKLAIIKACVDAQQYWLLFFALFTGMFTLLSMVKIWTEVFWKPAPEPVASDTEPPLRPTPLSRRQFALMVSPIILLASVTVAMGIFPQVMLTASKRAAVSILDTAGYAAVVGVAPVMEAIEYEQKTNSDSAPNTEQEPAASPESTGADAAPAGPGNPSTEPSVTDTGADVPTTSGADQDGAA